MRKKIITSTRENYEKVYYSILLIVAMAFSVGHTPAVHYAMAQFIGDHAGAIRTQKAHKCFSLAVTTFILYLFASRGDGAVEFSNDDVVYEIVRARGARQARGGSQDRRSSYEGTGFF